jgi:hypothetical protein
LEDPKEYPGILDRPNPRGESHRKRHRPATSPLLGPSPHHPRAGRKKSGDDPAVNEGDVQKSRDGISARSESCGNESDHDSMTRLQVSTVWRRIVEDPKHTCRARLAALQRIGRPSMSLLRRLLASPTTPRRLKLLAAEMYALAVARKELFKNARQIESRKDTDRPE